ncbi:recombinase family protein [uncultured Thiodictyon sp.]|uniref:recombinase family protein n=1 Tax=uncultured Thiodictyon sp. TaxID=1846217 RepID=UPI0025DE61ED|nr:recombinase family protein [uncultured Thiodictyon sp.]
MSKLDAEQLGRKAFVYIRQSTPDQVQHHRESRRRQYGLVERAHALGFADVEVIDEDLGRSGSGIARPGFERLLAAICCGEVGAVVAVEASRLARNGRDWHTLLEFCALVGTAIVDEEGAYDPRLPNDRLLLGMKGTLSEMELSILRQRAHEALLLKARRGELYTSVAVGYVRTAGNRLEKDPDLRVREAIGLVFAKFAGLQSVRQVLVWLRQEGIALPAVHYGPEGRAIAWRLPGYPAVHKLLTNPVYAGAYAFGRTMSRVRIEASRKRIVRGVRRSPADWTILIRDRHDGYIDWDTYERNQRMIADNASMKGEMARGAVRRGEAQLAGLLRCRRCGRKLHVAYSGTGGNTARYHCRGARVNHGVAAPCISFGALRIDAAVGAEALRLLQPEGIAAALQALERQQTEAGERRRQAELALEQARYEVARARRQYDAVDPDHRLVAAELERRWNVRLADVERLERTLAGAESAQPLPPLASERERLLALGADLERVWNHPGASPETRKRILRTLIREIVVDVEETTLVALVHWQGGDHTELRVRKNRTGEHRWATDRDTAELIAELARLLPDSGIASLLNRLGKRTAKGHTWTEARVRSWRGDHGIAVYRQGERGEREEVNLHEAAQRLGTSAMTVLRWIRERRLTARQPCPGAPWMIRIADLEALPQTGERGAPLTRDPRQACLDFQ